MATGAAALSSEATLILPSKGRGLGTNFRNLGTLLEILEKIEKMAKPLLYNGRGRD
jgi:hypothetical protein